MKRPLPLALAAALIGTLLLAAGAASAHNAGCVLTGTGDYVFVGSNRESPIVSEHNPNLIWDPARGDWQLDLQAGSGDQYGARFAVARGGSNVALPSRCTAPPPRGS